MRGKKKPVPKIPDDSDDYDEKADDDEEENEEEEQNVDSNDDENSDEDEEFEYGDEEDEDDDEDGDDGDDGDDEDDEEEEDEEDEIQSNCLYDQEILINEYEEMEVVEVPLEDRITPNTMTKYEICRVIGIRTQQLINGAKPLVTNTNGKSSVEIAIDELITQSLPFKIKRPLPSGEYEVWKCKELRVILSQDDIDDIISSINK